MTRAVILMSLSAAALLGGAASAGQPANADLPALRGIERGAWELRERGANGAVSKVCIANPGMLIQVRHVSATCSRFVIDNKPNAATVHYTCPGAGHGRTTIRVENSKLVQIQSQGIADNAPFAINAEARHIGPCS